MLTGPTILMIVVVLTVILYFLVVISLRGASENRLWSLDPVLRQNIRLSLMPQLKSFGSKFCYTSLGFLCHGHRVSGVIMSVLRI
jgi:hypothetical protein